MTIPRTGRRALTVRGGRLAVLMAALVAFAAKLGLAAGTSGTQDMRTWTGFAAGVRQQGPVGVYAIDFLTRNDTLYNHPPLVGYLLELLNSLSSWGVPLQLSLRAAAAVSDVACALVVFEILRRRRSVGTATVAGITLAASPILILVSGYHANTDPVMMTFLWLGCYLLVDRRRGALGGSAVAIAISVKLVPVVALPALAVWLVGRCDRRLFVRALWGFGATIGLVWGPALLFQWSSLRSNVLGYAGGDDRPWGLVRLLDSFDLPLLSTWLAGPGRYGILLGCALLPALLAWCRPRAVMECVAVSIVSFLVLSPAFGVQYLAWAAAACVILAARAALAYHVLGGLFLLGVYADWNRGLDWGGVAEGRPFRPIEVIAAWVVWAILVVVLHVGVRRALGIEPPRGPLHPAPVDSSAQGRVLVH